MNKKLIFSAMLVGMLALGLTLVGCDSGSGGGGDGGGGVSLPANLQNTTWKDTGSGNTTLEFKVGQIVLTQYQGAYIRTFTVVSAVENGKIVASEEGEDYSEDFCSSYSISGTTLTLVGTRSFSGTYTKDGTTSGGSGTTVPVSGVSLDKTALTLTVGGTGTLTATVAPSNASNKQVSWSSSDSSKVTVSNGTVNAVAVGSAPITVTTADGSYTATCAVTVTSSGGGGNTGGGVPAELVGKWEGEWYGLTFTTTQVTIAPIKEPFDVSVTGDTITIIDKESNEPYRGKTAKYALNNENKTLTISGSTGGFNNGTYTKQ